MRPRSNREGDEQLSCNIVSNTLSAVIRQLLPRHPSRQWLLTKTIITATCDGNLSQRSFHHNDHSPRRPPTTTATVIHRDNYHCNGHSPRRSFIAMVITATVMNHHSHHLNGHPPRTNITTTVTGQNVHPPQWSSIHRGADLPQ